MQPFFESKHNRVSVISGEKSEFPPHFHKEVELFFLFEGGAEVGISGKKEKLNTGDIAIIFPNEIHEYNVVANSSSKHSILIFDPSLCVDFFSVFMNMTAKNPIIRSKEQPIELRDSIIKIITLLKKDPSTSEILIKGHLTILLFHMLNLISTEKNSYNANSDIAAQVINYISAHYLEPISLDSLSLSLGYSKYEVSRVFSKKLGVNFNGYLNSRRAEFAVSLLKDTSIPITEVAFASGFESLRTFYRVFSDKYKVSPMKYRMNNVDLNAEL